MTAFAILARLWALPLVHGIPRSVNLAIAIATAASEWHHPKRAAAELDVIAAFETGDADADAAGGCRGVPVGVLCRREDGARYCGPYMIRCELVPVGAALRLLDESRAVCPRFPYGRFVGVGCKHSALPDLRAREINREVAR